MKSTLNSIIINVKKPSWQDKMTNKKTSDYLVERTSYFSKLLCLKLKSIEPKSQEILSLPTTQHELYHHLLLYGNQNILPLQKLELSTTIGFLDFSYGSCGCQVKHHSFR